MSPEMNRVLMDTYTTGEGKGHMFTVGALKDQGYITKIRPGAGSGGRERRSWAVKREYLTPLGRRYCEERLRALKESDENSQPARRFVASTRRGTKR